MHRQARTVSPRDRQKRRSERDLIILGKILLAHAHPAAAGRERCLHHVGERQTRLMSIGNNEERRVGELHAQNALMP
jgi:hypothetical protein